MVDCMVHVLLNLCFLLSSSGRVSGLVTGGQTDRRQVSAYLTNWLFLGKQESGKGADKQEYKRMMEGT